MLLHPPPCLGAPHACTYVGRRLNPTALPCALQNPYQEVIEIVGRTLEVFDDDKLIPAFGFGDAFTTDKQAFPFYPDRRPCNTFGEVISRYMEITPGITLSGPTNFAPVIREAVNIVKVMILFSEMRPIGPCHSQSPP